MKFIVSSSALLKQLQSINGVVANNPVVPILENFLFDVTDGLLTITASDLETSMITEIAVEAKENGRIAAPARILLDTLKNLPDQPDVEQDFRQFGVGMNRNLNPHRHLLHPKKIRELLDHQFKLQRVKLYF